MLRLLAAAAAVALISVPAANAAPSELKVPNHLSFGNAAVGSVGEEFVTLTNTSAEPLTVSSVGVSSETGSFRLDFASDTCVGVTLAPGDSCTYGILYTPVVPGRQVGTSDVEFGTSGLVFIDLSGHAK